MTLIIETRRIIRNATPRYKDLYGKKATEEYALDLTFEVIYACWPKCRGPKPLKNIKTLIKIGKNQEIGNRENLETLQYELFTIVRGKKDVENLTEFIKGYLYESRR